MPAPQSALSSVPIRVIRAIRGAAPAGGRACRPQVPGVLAGLIGAALACAGFVDASAAERAAPTRTSWPSFRNDPQQTGVAGSTLPEKLELLWKRPAADGVTGACAIAGEHVYVPEVSGLVVCVERQSGQPVWSYRSVADPKAFAPGFKAAPTVTADTVYVGDEDGVLHAVERATGRQKWTFATMGEIAGSAAVVGEHVVFGSHDSFLYCLKAAGGELVWKLQTDDRINCSTGVSDGHTFVTGCDGRLRVIDIDSGRQKSNIELSTYIIASPALVGEMLYVGDHSGAFTAINWRDGRVAWTHKDERSEFPFHASAAVTDQRVVVGSHDKNVYCLDRADGEVLWRFPTRARVSSSAAIVGERVLVGSDDGHVYELSLADGRERWKFKAGRKVSAGMAVGEGVLVFGTDESNGMVYCFGARE
ncbi:MAG TPA: PQQ-binding-like beta-propeller repeat protein [Planctomycetaceae bacterium]|nr:PQQ-binding-like beta-propeller repeat protein [Planctomycetaceae bacterium]